MSVRLPALNRLMDYLQKGALEQDFFLNQSQTMSFHWADSDATCWWMAQEKNMAPSDPRAKELAYQMEELRREEVWVRDQQQMRAISLYDFFTSQVDPEYMGIDFKRPDVMVSTLGPQGQYFNVGINGIPEASRFEDFVHHKVLDGSMAWRKFRVRTDVPLLSFIQGEFEQACLLLIRQISCKGILFYVPSAQVFQRLLAADFVHALIDAPGICNVLEGHSKDVHSPLDGGALLFAQNPEQLYRLELKRHPTAPPHQWMMEKLWGRGQRFIFVPFIDILRENGVGHLGLQLTPLLEEMEHEIQKLTRKRAG